MKRKLSVPSFLIPSSPWRGILLAFVLAFCFSAAHAFDVNGRIKGNVVDATGAVVPNVTVVATNQLTGIKYTTKSQANGDYLFPELPVGTYSISVSVPGFKTFTATGIVLTIDQEYVEPVALATGSTGENIEVVADSVQVNTTDMQLSNIVDSTQMEELPLIGRAFTGLELIEPGVQASSDRFGTYSVSGAQTQQSSFLINGADINDLPLNTPVVNPNLDAIDQFNLIEGPLNAEYDRNSGGVVSATIKQGTNHFHGDVFEFYRDTFLDTPNFFAYNVPSPGSTTPGYKTITPYHQNIYGGTIGGPILRDKFFGFFGFQGTHERVPGSDGSSNVFSTAQRTGDFSTDFINPTLPPGQQCQQVLGYCFAANPIPASITIPGCNNATDTWLSCATRLNGVFPASAFNPISAKLLSTYIPLPNNSTNGYNYPSVSATKDNQFIGRLDFNPTEKNRFTFVGIYDHSTTLDTIPFTGATLPGFGEVDAATVQQYTFDYVRQFSPSLVNDFAIHYTRFNFPVVFPQNVVSPSSLGFNITPQDAAAASVPTMGVGSYFTLGFSTNGPQPRIDQTYQADDNLSKSWGHHNLKFGYDIRKFYVENPFNASNSGNYGFSAGGTYSSGDPGLDFLFGNSNSYAQGSGALIQAYAWLNYMYAQDSWKVTNTLTLNFGLGYQIDTPLDSLQYGGEAVACYKPGQQSVIFPTAPLGLDYPGDKGCGTAAGAYTRFGDFGPRIGFAYAPDLGIFSGGNSKKLAIRGGFGIYYNRTEEETALQNLETPPFGGSTGGAGDFGGVPSFANPFADINNGLTTGPVVNKMPTPGQASEPNKFPFVFAKKGENINFAGYEPMYLNTYNANFRSPYAENFQLTVERELPSHTIARVSYVGSLAHHNQTTTEGNPVTPAGHAACLADPSCSSLSTQYYRAYQPYFFPGNTAYGYVDPNSGVNPFFGIGTIGSAGSSNYNALQVGIQKGLSHGLQMQVSYTYAHAMDTASSFENSGFGEGSTRGYNQFNTGLNYGDAAFDARQRLVIAPIYVVPRVATGSEFKPLNLLLSGWQVSGIATFANGFPYDIAYGGGSANSEWCAPYATYYACPDEPNQIAPLVHSNPRVRDAGNPAATDWFQNNGFLAPAPLGQFGTISRDKFHGPGINNTNMILAKNFSLSADGVRRLQLRMESDNVFNHTQFNNPSSGVSTQQDQVPGSNPAVFYTGLSTSGLGQIGGAASGRLTQIAAKIYF
jgi:hypothetical protein